ncbi:MAG: YbaB/EbfC family nucleoid-associated protein [Alphaproteobacteria bacterium]|nr:YbaB/EbfC family nucleoid-associated protein [Alphaproteobacteria bacterium]
MKNFKNMIKQAQEIQSKMTLMQEKLAEVTVEGNSGGGMVVAVINGKGELKSITIDPTLLNPKEIEILEDLIVAACNDAKMKADKMMSEEMVQLTGGLPLPGNFKLPF